LLNQPVEVAEVVSPAFCFSFHSLTLPQLLYAF